MHSEGYSTWSVCVCVCVSVTTFSAIMRNRTSNKRYQRLQCDTGKVFKMAFSLKMFRSKVMALYICRVHRPYLIFPMTEASKDV